jgi:hypothetical protein
MRSYHLVKRGNRYHFVCRVPRDLLPLFPTPTIWKSLRAEARAEYVPPEKS